MEYQIISMTKDVIDTVLKIEEESFGEHHWGKQAFYDELSSNLANYYCIVDIDKNILGYAGFWHIIDEAHITTVAVKPNMRRKKLGELMLNHIINECFKKEIKYITLEVRVSNKPAINMYEKYGFKSLGTRKNYYQDNHEDALIMWTENIFWDKFKELYNTNTNKLRECIC